MSGGGVDIGASVDPDRAVGRLAALVRTPSENPPGEEAKVAELVASMCEELELEVSLHEAEPGRPSVIARWGTGEPPVAYCSHIDVVPAGDPSLWEHQPFGAEVDDGLLYGRGACDAKGPVAAALEAVAALKDAGFTPTRTLELALVADEETMGFKGTGHLVDQGVLRPARAIVGEPTSLRVVRAQRGACWFRITTRGLAAHGSAPERGRSAILHMAEVLLRLQDTLPDVSHELLGGPSINVGTIRGGEKTNIVAASCVAEIDRRTVPGETQMSVTESIERAIGLARERFPEIDARIELEFNSRPFEVAQDSTIVREVAAAVTAISGEPAQLIGFRGASDARFLAEAGAEVVVFGPGDIRLAHTARENIELDEFRRGAQMYAHAFARLVG